MGSSILIRSILVLVVGITGKLIYDNFILLENFNALNDHTDSSITSTLNETWVQLQIQQLLNKPEPLPLAPSSSQVNNVEKILFDEEFKGDLLRNLQGAIQIETESFDHYPNPLVDLEPWNKFFKFHEYLEHTFPLVHSHLTLEKPNGVALLYTWKGSNPDLKPLLLIAHQDVVPIDPSTAHSWNYPPYSGHFDGENIWGRGSIDCKTLLLAELEATEQLIRDGFQPQRTILLGFGNDEEIGGKGAASINETLTERYGSNSLYAILDEGTAIERLHGAWSATVGTSEKGFVNVDIALKTKGGHSSIPPKHTSIGIMSKLVHDLESHPFQPRLTVKNPFLRTLQTTAKHSNKFPEQVKNDVLRAEFDPEANQRVIGYLQNLKPDALKFLIQTSQAVDKFHGGVKANALPEYVEVTINHRISVESTLNQTLEHDLTFIRALADEFSLGLFYEGKELQPISATGGYFNVTLDGPVETLPVSPDHGPVWDVLTGTIKHIWSTILNETIYVTPTLMPANTDTKKYFTLTPNIFRFFPMRIQKLGNLGIHSVNEHTTLRSHVDIVAFVYEFILNANEGEDW